jgi:hypothetical protein|tara:strand:+ start:754 stop:1245 length:492 start_codon:yes stop_codon:yes gene_type:complete
MSYKIVDNFIEDPKVFNIITEKLFSDAFPWYYSDNVAYSGENNKSFYFVHNFFRDGKQQSDWMDIMHPVLGRLQFNHLLHIRANCYTNVTEPLTHDYHVDRHTPHKVALYSLNDNNGYTQFEKTEEKVQSVRNRLLLFDGEDTHRSTTQTDENLRINININYV